MPATSVVVLVPTLEVDRYKSALAGGADGVARVDAHPTTIAHVAAGAVNGGNAESVAEFAATAPAATLEFLIGGRPYEKVGCYTVDGKD